MSTDSSELVPTVDGLIRARHEDDNLGLVLDERAWTWRQVVAESARRAQWLIAELDSSRPPHIGVLLPNVPDYVFTLFGAALAGACVVGINPTRRGTELTRDVVHADCQFVLTDTDGAAMLEVDCPVFLIDEAPWSSYSDVLPINRPGPETLWLLIFTSGSTSAPKAVRRTQGRVAGGANLGFRPTDVLYCPMPLFHGNALSSSLLPGLAGGSTVVLRERFSANRWLSDVRRYGVTFTNTVGRALGYVLATEPSEVDRDHHLRFVLAPESSPHDVERFAERFGVRVISGYGQSEGVIVLLPVGQQGAMGRAAPGMDLAVVDPEDFSEKPRARFDEGGRLLNADEAIGELVRRDVGFGSATSGGFEGYWRNEQADADRVRNGWYWSGDLVFRDVDDVFWFAGRVGDWLRVDAENFAAAPIERIIDRHVDVKAVAVVGVPDPQGGDQVLAALEVTDAFDPATFGAWLRDQPDLGTKWAPRFVRLCSHLPVTGTDKIDRRPLRAEAWMSTDPVWWRPGRTQEFVLMTDEDRRALRVEFERHGRQAAHPS